MADPCPAEARQAPPEDRLRALALHILEERERRRWHFPRAVFDEIPWEILLLLYASRYAPLSRAVIADGVFASRAVVDRWIDYLEQEGLIGRMFDCPPSLGLTPSGLASLELYLRDRLQRSGGAGPGANAGASGLSGWPLAFLLLGMAIMSTTLGWALAAP